MRPWLRTALPSALVALALTLPGSHALAAPAPAAPTFLLEATLGRQWELIGGTDPGVKLTIIHRNASGAQKAVYKVQGDEIGEWSATCSSKGNRAGDRFVIKTRPGGVTLRTVTVPRMALNVNRATDTISGIKGVAGAPGAARSASPAVTTGTARTGSACPSSAMPTAGSCR